MLLCDLGTDLTMKRNVDDGKTLQIGNWSITLITFLVPLGSCNLLVQVRPPPLNLLLGIMRIQPQLRRRVAPLIRARHKMPALNFGPRAPIPSLLQLSIFKMPYDPIHARRFLHLTRALFS